MFIRKMWSGTSENKLGDIFFTQEETFLQLAWTRNHPCIVATPFTSLPFLAGASRFCWEQGGWEVAA